MKLPQLTLRELFLLVVIAALGCGWWVDHRGQVAGKQELFDAVDEAGFVLIREESGGLWLVHSGVTK